MNREPRYYVYIMASRSLNLYTGITNNLYRRALEHKRGDLEGFTKRYRIERLVYCETFKYVGNAIRREKQIKSWTRAKRLELIKSTNPTWQDLAEDWGKPFKLQIPRFARDDNPKDSGGTPEGVAFQSVPQGLKPVSSAKANGAAEARPFKPRERPTTNAQAH
ncbi:MAG TPA: GIY-YIG nuclease family protein [Terriglobales bacterium]|nr:GIY-YIG nuclease family protein [Terriglobales bacterium]